MTDLPESKGHPRIKVEDRRHWARRDEEEEPTAEAEASAAPPEIEELRTRAETAEGKLREFAAALQQWKLEHEQVRARLERDVETRVALRFGDLVAELLETVDDLDLAIDHARGLSDAAPFVDGVALARDRFVNTLARHGIERLRLDGSPFDPNVAEAVAVEPVDDPAADGTVVRTVRPGYRLGERIVRAARVSVGRAMA